MVRPSGGGKPERKAEGRYKGVRMRKWGKWVAEVRQPNSRDRIWLGSYDTPEEAARAYDAALFCLRGPSAIINFPSQPPDIPTSSGADLSPSEIQVVASRHARGLSTNNSSLAEVDDQLTGCREEPECNLLREFESSTTFFPVEEGGGSDGDGVDGGVVFERQRLWAS